MLPLRRSKSKGTLLSHSLEAKAAAAAVHHGGDDAADKDPIILTTADYDYLSALLNWLECVRRKGRLHQVLVIATDQELYEFLRWGKVYLHMYVYIKIDKCTLGCQLFFSLCVVIAATCARADRWESRSFTIKT